MFKSEPSLKAKVRAALLAIVILTQMFLALPMPHKLTEASLNRPEAKEEFGRWMSLIHSVGLDWKRAEVKKGLIEYTHTFADAHKTAAAPFKPARKYFGIGQSWALFAAPDTHPNRMQVEARVNGEWVLVFRRIDSEHTMMTSQISFRRVRGIHDSVGQKPGKIYHALCEFIARGVFDQMPEADAIRVQMYRHHVTPPHKPSDDTLLLRHTVNVSREEVGR